jgi:hypothetical protein
VSAAILDDHLRSGQDGVHDFLLRLPWAGLWPISEATTIPNKR